MRGDADVVDLGELVRNAPDLIQSMAPDGRLLFVNRAWRAQLACGEQPLDRFTFFDFLVPRERAAWRDLLERATPDGPTGLVEATLVGRDGETVTVEGKLHVQERDGQTVAIHGIFRRRDAPARRPTPTAAALPETNLPETNLPETNLSETNLPETNLPEMNLSAATVPGEMHSAEQLPSGPRVLVAEDNLVNQRIVRHLLEQLGCRVTLVPNGQEALERVEGALFDLVIMDLHMPLLDGWEATRQIRAREAASGGHLPVIALTACAADGEEQKCLQAGMDGYLTKPLEPAQLAAILDALPCRAAVDGDHARRPVGARGDVSAGRPRTPVFDQQAALSRLGNDAQILVELAEIFLEECAPMVSSLESAVDRRDARAVRHGAHRIKSCVANFFAQPTYEAAEALELQGRRHELTGSPQTFQRLVRELNRLRAALRNLIERHSESSQEDRRGL